MQTAARTAQRHATAMGLTLVAMAAGAALVGGLGVVNYLNGYALRAAASLVLPIFLGYWAWQARDNLGAEPLIPIFSAAWLTGLPIGALAFAVRQALT